MMYELRKVTKNTGKYPGDRWLVVEVGTSNCAVHLKEVTARTSLRYLNDGTAKFCECGMYILSKRGRNTTHVCADGQYGEGK